jgi:hypothetical protein
MRAIKSVLAALGLCCLSSAAPAQAAPTAYVLGDSLGLGVAMVSHLKNLSRISIHIRGNKMQEQIARTPPGSTVFLVLGTNDANGSIAKLDKSIDDIIQAFERKHITLIWMGPPCVRQSWDTRARELDAMLKQRFENTAVRYVSMRDDELCSGGGYHERDGVHMKMKGYAHMWEKARLAAGFEEPATTTVATVPAAVAKPAAVKPIRAKPGAAPVAAVTELSRTASVEYVPLPRPRVEPVARPTRRKHRR